MAGFYQTSRFYTAWVNNGLYRQPCHTSAYPPEADENDAKAEVAVGMSAVGGKADVARWWLELPFLPSRPGEFHPEPLTEPDVILSHHPAHAIA